jgi:multicomponent Na+:H+ antiporter subunit C
MINGLHISIILFLIGLYGVITNKNVIKIVMSLAVMENGILLFFISLGYVIDSSAPIMQAGIVDIVDPLPQTLMLTQIVINLCFTALALTIVVWLHHYYKTLDIGEMK